MLNELSQGKGDREQEEAPLIRRWALDRLARFFLIAAGVAVFGLLLSLVIAARNPSDGAAPLAASAGSPTNRPTRLVTVAPSATATSSPSLVPTRSPSATRPATATATPDTPFIALLAGHSGGIDPGAICPDGLREVDVTTDVVTRTRTILQERGYRVEVLAEFDPKLSNTRRDYAPKAFLSVHADSCVYYATGYKVARAANSGSPEEDDRLVRCVTADYGAATQLPFHADSITADMTRYHAFNEIDQKSPSAIIELGFLGSEHDLLKNKRELLAEGIANGVDDFMRGNSCKKPANSSQ